MKSSLPFRQTWEIVRRSKSWIPGKIRLQHYDYDGNDGRRVIDWILHLGWFWLIKYRIGYNRKEK
jgi:hypothetical protein